MSVRDKKDDIIKEIMDLRALIGEIETSENEDSVLDIQRQVNKIHDIVFSI